MPAANGKSNGVNSGQDGGWHSTPIVINPALNAPDARDYSFAFTAADATACPYLQFGALLCAGILGLREALPAPAGGACDTSHAGSKNGGGGAKTRPNGGAEAWGALGQDEVFRNAFPDGLLQAYTDVKQAELATASRLSPDELGEWSQEIY